MAERQQQWWDSGGNIISNEVSTSWASGGELGPWHQHPAVGAEVHERDMAKDGTSNDCDTSNDDSTTTTRLSPTPVTTKKATKPFRLLDLPPEIRTLIYEQVAQETHITNFRLTMPHQSRALLKTCKLIRHELIPILHRCANFSLLLKAWNFGPLRQYLNCVTMLEPDTLKALQENEKITLMVSAEQWDEEKHLQQIKDWLSSGEMQLGVEFRYCMKRKTKGVGAWKSKSQFMWMTGVEELRQLQASLPEERLQIEVGKMISALEQEGEYIGAETTRKRGHTEQKTRELANKYSAQGHFKGKLDALIEEGRQELGREKEARRARHAAAAKLIHGDWEEALSKDLARGRY